MKNIFKIASCFIILLLPFWTSAQCAVCAAGVASSAHTNGAIATGINSGILYLLAVTYLVFMTAGIYFLRNRIRYYFRTLHSRWRMFLASF